MTDISHHISRLINDVFESGPPLNGTLIGVRNLLFNQGREFIAEQSLVSLPVEMYDWSL